MEKSILIYTDGASRGNPGLGAAGFIIIDPLNSSHKGVKCYENVTNNRMEILAILMALKYCYLLNWVDAKIELYSDSAWAIGAGFKNWNISVNKDYVDEVRKLKSKFKNLKITKVKGHDSCEGNNEVDSLLNSAMDNYKRNDNNDNG